MKLSEAIENGKFVRRESWPAAKRLKANVDTLAVTLEEYEATDWVPVGPIVRDFYKAVEEYEKHILLEALSYTDGWMAPAAKLLKLNRTTFSTMAYKYGLVGPRGDRCKQPEIILK